VPHWLDADHPRITVIDHADLLGGSRFNSHAIESALHRIPGLAEHYLYLNDDVFFGRIAYPGDFFPAPGMAAFFPSDLPIDPGPVSAQDLPIMAAAKNGRALLAARFGLDVRTKIRHTVHAQLRSVGEQIEAEHPEEVARTRDARFRSPTDLSLASSLHHWYAHALGRAVPQQPNYLYVDLASPGVEQTLDALESLRRYDTFCLNQEQTGMSPALRREVGEFLERYLPTPAPWERPAQPGPRPPSRAEAARDAATRYPAGVESAADTLDLPGMAETDAPAQQAERDPDHPHPGQWRLIAVQVSNWGTFHGTHDLAISSKGFFLTGGPGTGKSTLLDAISALLTPPRTLQFNAAASDAGPNRSKYR